MKQTILISVVLCFSAAAYAAYLDDWTNDDLCGWMESSSTPEYIQKEVEKREILCYGGIEVSSLPTEENRSTENGTVFASPDPALIPEIKPDKDKSYTY